MSVSTFEEITTINTGEIVACSACSNKLVVTTKVKLRFVIMVADISVNTGLSTSNVLKMVYQVRVATIEYDPNRTANIALIHYADGEKAYIIAPKGLKVDDQIVSGPGCRYQNR